MFRRLQGPNSIRWTYGYKHFRLSLQLTSVLLITTLLSLPPSVQAQESATPVVSLPSDITERNDPQSVPNAAPDDVASEVANPNNPHVATPSASTVAPSATPPERCASGQASPAPEVSIAPLDFGRMQWNGSSWSSANASTTVLISRNDCATQDAYDIQIEIVDGTPGFAPMLVDASTSDEIAITTFGDPNNGPLTIAHIAPGFIGNTTLQLDFQLQPGNTLQPGTHLTQIVVSAVRSP